MLYDEIMNRYNEILEIKYDRDEVVKLFNDLTEYDYEELIEVESDQGLIFDLFIHHGLTLPEFYKLYDY